MQELDLDGEWDPDKHDRQMGDIYGNNDDDIPADDEKPQWDDDIDVDDIVPPEASSSEKKKKKKKKRKHDDEDEADGVDPDQMDAEIEHLGDDEEWDGTEEMRKKKLEEYMDEVYGLEFNDMVRI